MKRAIWSGCVAMVSDEPLLTRPIYHPLHCPLIPGTENTDSRPPDVMAGLDPAIGYPHQFANDAIPVSNHPMEMARSSQVTTR
jgi:hypothetical protein